MNKRRQAINVLGKDKKCTTINQNIESIDKSKRDNEMKTTIDQKTMGKKQSTEGEKKT
jgi:hypothetical protein